MIVCFYENENRLFVPADFIFNFVSNTLCFALRSCSYSLFYQDVTNANRRKNAAGNTKKVAGQKRGVESIVNDSYLPSRQRTRVTVEQQQQQPSSFQNTTTSSSSGAILPVRQVSLPKRTPAITTAIVDDIIALLRANIVVVIPPTAEGAEDDDGGGK